MCNYTFEYDAAPRASGGARAAPVPIQGGILVLALGAGIVAAMALGASLDGTAKRPEIGAFMVATGVFAVAGSLFAWRWFFGARRSRLLAALLGLTGARVFYALLGGALTGGGVAMLLA